MREAFDWENRQLLFKKVHQHKGFNFFTLIIDYNSSKLINSSK